MDYTPEQLIIQRETPPPPVSPPQVESSDSHSAHEHDSLERLHFVSEHYQHHPHEYVV